VKKNPAPYRHLGRPVAGPTKFFSSALLDLVVRAVLYEGQQAEVCAVVPGKASVQGAVGAFEFPGVILSP
jgi:hypothetical protein